VSTLADVRPATAQEAVAAALRQAIVERQLRPGDRIRQEEVAQRLGVSVIPVREALKVLEGEGQVTYQPRQGYAVAQLNLADLAEVYRLRELLEAEAVRAALPHLADADVDEIAAEFEAVTAALAAGRLSEAMAANRRAHFRLFETARMPVLLRHVRMLWDSTQAYRALYYNEAARQRAVDREHGEILAALRARNAERVLALLDAHRRHALGALAEVL
jgi:DNA-binding GntR family transcriptional regulator